ncbi:hypothetical protein B0H15DRAFT_916593 [Mycena belliarum]|uniref:Tse2 ADP-ribosyltransferase toxin domain-containing protein n=1 Tax=Mycena belliarum TaxID=1033014 RepID=A0AAD6TV43_9AGAR|nr:hypothetical protein B0H15DRAFT_916593 [Mycena belliae]
MPLLGPRRTLLSLARGAARAYSTPVGSRPLIARYAPGTALPVDLARVQSGLHVRLREYEAQKALKRFSYDLKVQPDGLVHPAEGPNFIGPNGCSLREPLSPTFQEVVRNFRGSDIGVFVLKEGTVLPETLTVLHEHSDHFSLQCTQPMRLSELNAALTQFINDNARILNKEEFDEEYPFSI